MTGDQMTTEQNIGIWNTSRLEQSTSTVTGKSRYAPELIRKAVHYLTNLNLFPSIPPSTDQGELRAQRISTRIFIVSLCLLLAILLIYTSAVDITKTVTVEAPDFNRYKQLHQEYQQGLVCPCKQISINYKTFLNITYTLHQVCSSYFVSGEWISIFIEHPNFQYLDPDDFISTGSQTFQALKALCTLVEQSISTNLVQFYETNYISATVTPTDLFQSQSETFIQQFISSTTNNFLLSLSLIRDTTHVNALLSTPQRNYVFHKNSRTIYFVATPVTYDDGCTCALSVTCTTQSMIHGPDILTAHWPVSGFYTGCFVLESLRRSNLGCLYDPICWSQLKSLMSFGTPITGTILNTSVSSRFWPNTTVDVILNRLMVEEWNWSITYEHYYGVCHPSRCKYTLTTKNNVIYMITTVIGLIGGLVTALKLIVGRLLWLIRYRARADAGQGVREKVRALPRIIIHYLRNFNLFPSIPPSTNKDDLRAQWISTRVFIMSLCLSLTILLIYTSTVDVTKTFTVHAPDFNRYKQLYQEYQQALVCPCKQISISYKTFLNITYTLHPVCSSYYVTDEWISSFLSITFLEVPYFGDFLLTGTQAFQALKAFCTLVEQTISISLAQFYATSYVSAVVIPTDLFLSQSETFIQQFISSTANSFLLSLSWIRDTTLANALLSALGTNYLLYIRPGATSVTRHSQTYDADCNCRYSGACTTYSAIHKNTSRSSEWRVPGFYTGCYLLEALRQSNLECFYNQTCLTELQSYMPPQSSINPTLLNSSLLARFSMNATIGKILDQLMVDEWSKSINYENYYTACQTTQCSYTIVTKNEAIYIITTLISLVGGLVTALKFLVPRLVLLIKKRLTPRTSTTGTVKYGQGVREAMRPSPRAIIHYLTNLNLFPSIPPSTNQGDLRAQRLSTRIFILSLCLSLTILLIYTSAVDITKTVTVEAPDSNRYKQLYKEYQQGLVCPCKQISINYKTFLNITHTLHQVCSSYYVTDEWILFFVNSNPGSLFLTDFRNTGRQIFQALKALCTLVEQSISTNLAQFYETNLVSAVVIPTDLFQSQSEAFIQQFISLTTSSFTLSLRRIRDITQVNSLAAALSTNVRFAGNSVSQELLMRWAIYDNDCICASSIECAEASVIYNSSHSVVLSVPGFYAGCFSLQTLRQCNLECFYNATCATELKLKMQSTSPISTSLLNSSVPSRFRPNTNVGTMLDLLMVDQWNWSIMHENYYTACQPSQCTYTIRTKNDAIYIVTTLIGLIGGMITALKLIVPNAVFIGSKCMRRRKRIRSTIQSMPNGWN